jgi:hypothetical protein
MFNRPRDSVKLLRLALTLASFFCSVEISPIIRGLTFSPPTLVSRKFLFSSLINTLWSSLPAQALGASMFAACYTRPQSVHTRPSYLLITKFFERHSKHLVISNMSSAPVCPLAGYCTRSFFLWIFSLSRFSRSLSRR